jgi:hypothetical protein
MLRRVSTIAAVLAVAALAPAAASAQDTCATPPTTAWTTGLEHGAPSFLSASLWWSNFNGYVDNTVARGGSRSLRLFKPETNGMAYTRKEGFGYNNVLSFALRLDELPSRDVHTLAKHETTASDLFLGYRAGDQRLTLRWGAQSPVASTVPVQAGVWFSIDLRWRAAGTSPMSADWSVDRVPQESTSIDEAGYGMSMFQFGNDLTSDPALKLRYDDIVYSRTPSDYPIGPSRVLPLRPNSTGAHVNPQHFQDDDGSAVDPTSHTRLDDADMSRITDGHVRQVATSTASSLEFGFDDTVEPCILAVQAISSLHKTSKNDNNAKTSVFDGPIETVVFSGNVGYTNVVGARSAVVRPAAGVWTPVAVNALTSRVGFSADASPNPMWDALLLEVAVPG